MTIRRTNFDIDHMIEEYLSGKSIKQLAFEHGFSRQVVYRVLRQNSIPIRGRSEAMYVRMAQTSPQERKRLALAANEAKRGLANSPEMLHKRALAHKRFIGKFEQEFAYALSTSGIPIIPQEPFLSYNLDIGCGDIAVEIHTQSAGPLSSKFIKKLMDCVKSGKSMLYVWIDPRGAAPTSTCYQNVISIVQAFRRDPPSRSKYWVVRGTGELYASGSFDCD